MKVINQSSLNQDNYARLIGFSGNAKLGVDRNGHLYEVKKSWFPLTWLYRSLFSQRPDRLEKALRNALTSAPANADKEKIKKIVSNSLKAPPNNTNELFGIIDCIGEDWNQSSAYPTENSNRRSYEQLTPPPSRTNSPTPELHSDIDTPIPADIAGSTAIEDSSKISTLRNEMKRIESEIDPIKNQVLAKIDEEMQTLGNLEKTRELIQKVQSTITDLKEKLSNNPINGAIQQELKGAEQYLKRSQDQEKRDTEKVDTKHSELVDLAKQELAKNEELLRIARDIKEADPTAVEEIENIITKIEARIAELKTIMV